MRRRPIAKLQVPLCLALLTLCVAGVELWAFRASFPIRDIRSWGLFCDRGTIEVRTLGPYRELPPDGVRRTSARHDVWDARWGALGIEYARGTHCYARVRHATTIVRVPLWLPAAAAAMPAALWARALVRRTRGERRAAQGYCAACNYDLRASSNRCPECGLAKGAT